MTGRGVKIRSRCGEDVGKHDHELRAGLQHQQRHHKNCRGQMAKVNVMSIGHRGRIVERCAPKHKSGVSIWVMSSIKD